MGIYVGEPPIVTELIKRGAEAYEKYYDPKTQYPLGIKTIGVGDGWFELLEELHMGLVCLCPDYQIMGIKQKFGGLRFTVAPSSLDSWLSDECFKLIHEAENKSFEICEETGKPGVLMRGKRGLRTLDPTFYGPPDWYRVQPLCDMNYKVKT